MAALNARSRRLAAACAVALYLVAAPVLGLPLWELQGTTNRIYLLGSVHFLRAEDYPLPDSAAAVFDDADVIVFEIDMSSLDPVGIQETLHRLAIDPRGRDLEDQLGAGRYRTAESLAAGVGIELATLLPYEPWFAALQITQLRLAQLGFDGSWGIETRFTLQAAAEGKEIRGLETLDEQFSAMDSLPAAAQRQFLIQTLEDAADIEKDLDRIISAWRAGDTQTLEEELLAGLADQPDLYDRILVARNRNWTRQIISFARGPKNVLVVVGALHLVGKDSVIRMLDEAGYPSRQLR